MKAFDLEKALAGEPVRDLSGNKRYILKHPENGYLVTYAMDNIAVCCSTIWYKNINQDEFSMFEMCEEPPPTVTLTLPCPLSEPQEGMWFIDDINSENPIGKSEYTRNNHVHWMKINHCYLYSGVYFSSKEDAQAWLDALKNSRR